MSGAGLVHTDRHSEARQFPLWSVSSLMLEAAVRLLDAATVSNPPHC